VSEFIYGHEAGRFCDLGPDLADAVSVAVEKWGKPVGAAHQGIRATVVGASQYTVQVSGSTIFLDPPDAVPVRNVAVIAPAFDLSGEAIDEEAIAAAVSTALARLDLAGGDQPVAVATPWRGSATFHRLGALCQKFRNNEVRLQLHALAYNLGNFMRTLALPKAVEHWSLTTLREKLIKIGAKVVSHGRYVTFQLAEVAVPRELFRKILRLIDGLRPAPLPP
jgi:ethanolamine utilization protein EutA (predicted chaperonin)